MLLVQAAKEYFEGHVQHWIPLEIHEEQYEHVLSTVRFVTGHVAKDQPMFLDHQERMPDNTIVFHSVPKEILGLPYILRPYEVDESLPSVFGTLKPFHRGHTLSSSPTTPQWLSQGFRKLDGMLLEGRNSKTSSIISFQIYKSNSHMSGQILLGENTYDKSTSTERFIVAVSPPLPGTAPREVGQHVDYNPDKGIAVKPSDVAQTFQPDDSADDSETFLPKSDAELLVESWYSSELVEKEYGRFRQRHGVDLIERASSNLYKLCRPLYLRRAGKHTAEDDNPAEEEMFMIGVYIRRFIAAATFHPMTGFGAGESSCNFPGKGSKGDDGKLSRKSR
eukprot:768452-Hanusia_phi.AAC.13